MQTYKVEFVSEGKIISIEVRESDEQIAIFKASVILFKEVKNIEDWYFRALIGHR